RQDQGNRSRRFVRFLCSGGAGGEALAVLDGRLRRRFVAQCLEVGSDLFGFAPVGGIKGSTRTNARRQLVETGDGACEHGLRGGGQRSTALLQPEKALLERLGRPRHEREPPGAMDTAERVTGTDHRLRRGQRRIGLQRLQLRVQRRQVLLRLVAQDSVERTRECHLPDGDLVGLEAGAESSSGNSISTLAIAARKVFGSGVTWPLRRSVSTQTRKLVCALSIIASTAGVAGRSSSSSRL